MRKLIAALLALVAVPALAQTPPTDTIYMSGLSAATTIADTDTTFVCQIGAGCASGDSLVRATGTQMTTYYRSKFSASSPLSFNASTGAFSLPLASALLLVGSGGGVATAVPASGDLTLATSGAFTVGSLGGKAVSLGGSLTTAGASSLTFTTTGATNVTLPTSGTLITSTGITGQANGNLAIGSGTTTLGSNVAFGLTGNSTVVQTTAAGKLTASLIPDTAVTPGSYTNANITVTQDGRLTAAANGTGGGGGGAGIVFAGTTTGSSNAYALSALGFALTDGWMVNVIPNFTNTTAATINVNATGATAIKAMNNTGTPVALKGGELVWSGTGGVGNSYLLRYSSAAAAFIMQDPPPSGGTIGATTTTITQAQWQSFHVFVVTTAGQTFTLPVATGLSPGGGILIQTIGVTTQLIPNAADGIKTGSATPSLGSLGTVTIPADVTVIASTTGSSGATAFNLPLGQTLSFTTSWTKGMDLSAGDATNGIAVPFGRTGTPRTIGGIVCLPTASVGGTATIEVWAATSGSIPPAGGTKLNTTDCNANTGPGTEQSLGVASATLAANSWIYYIAKGAGFGASLGSGGLQISYR